MPSCLQPFIPSSLLLCWAQERRIPPAPVQPLVLLQMSCLEPMLSPTLRPPH